MALDLFALAAIIPVFTIESIIEAARIIENKVEISKTIDHEWRIGERYVSSWGVTLHIEVLMPCVQWRRKQTALLPFERLPAPFIIPDSRRSPSFDDVNELLEQIPLRATVRLCRYLTNVNIASSSCTD